MKIITINLFDLLGIPEPFFAFDQFLRMLEEEGFKSDDERLCCIGGFIVESWAPDQSMQCYPFNGKYDLSKLSGTWAARLAYRVGAICDLGITPVEWAREWCGRLFDEKWAVNPHNKANNKQKRGGSTPEDMTRIELVETIERPLLEMTLDAIKPKYRKLLHIGVSNEPPMLKWSDRIRGHFPVIDSEKKLVEMIHKKVAKVRVHASCSEETFHSYGEPTFVQGIGTIHCHNLYREADCKRAYGEPNGPLRGFQPGGKYYGKYWPVIPDCDGTKGIYYDLTPTDFVHVLRRYDGQGLLWNLDKKHLKDLTIPPTPADWNRMIAKTRPHIRALLR